MADDSNLSRRLARIIGPALIAIASSEALNMEMFSAQTPPVVYLNGTILFVTGLAIVGGHNRWSRSWAVLVTLTGWGALLLGLYRMFLPGSPQAAAGLSTTLLLAALFVAGAVLSVAAYSRRSNV